MKYAVAYMNYFDNDLKLTVVEADNPITAIVEGVRKMTEAKDDDRWLNSFLEDAARDKIGVDDYAERIEYIRQEFFNTDALVAVMPIE